MKRFLLILSYLLLATPSWAVSVIGSGVAAPAGCSSASGGDLANEGFEGTGSELTWTGTDGTVSFDAEFPGTNPTGGCDDSAYFAGQGTNWRTLDLGSLKTTVYVRFKLYIDSHNIAAAGSTRIITLDTNTYPLTNYKSVLLHNTAGTLQLSLDASTKISVAVDTLYSVEAKFTNGGTNYIDVATGDTYGGTQQTVASGFTNSRFLYLGDTNTDTNYAEFYIDALEVDDDGTFDN